VSAAAGEQNTDEPGLCFLCCAVVPSVVDVTVVTPYESQVTLKVCVAGLHQLCLLPHTNANESHLKEQEQDIQERERERERERDEQWLGIFDKVQVPLPAECFPHPWLHGKTKSVATKL
jgi:hypothetical protein